MYSYMNDTWYFQLLQKRHKLNLEEIYQLQKKSHGDQQRSYWKRSVLINTTQSLMKNNSQRRKAFDVTYRTLFVLFKQYTYKTVIFHHWIVIAVIIVKLSNVAWLNTVI